MPDPESIPRKRIEEDNRPHLRDTWHDGDDCAKCGEDWPCLGSVLDKVERGIAFLAGQSDNTNYGLHINRLELQAILTLALAADGYREALEKVFGVTTAHIKLQKAIKMRDAEAANAWMAVIKSADAVLADVFGAAEAIGGKPE